MDSTIYSDDILRLIKKHARSLTAQTSNVPRFIFACGGNEDRGHPARLDLRRYVSRNIENVYCLSAESVVHDNVFEGVDFLKQEAMMVDVADCVIIFAESPGSICELGAFTVLPHALEITSVVLSRREKGNRSFLTLGPAKAIESHNSELARVFYSDLQCPLMDKEFIAFLDNIREAITRSERAKRRERKPLRKRLNTHEDDVNVGSLVHELIDLINLLQPITREDLLEVYCYLKEFEPNAMRIVSPTIKEDMRDDSLAIVSFNKVIDFMVANSILFKEVLVDGSVVVSSLIKQERPFLFKDKVSKDFFDIRARVLLRKRERKIYGVEHVYRRFDER